MKVSKQLIFLFLLYIVHFTHAQTLKQFTFQGKLSDVNENFTGTKSIEFTIYDLNDILWREIHQNVAIENGNYELKLGSATPFPATLFKTEVIERTVVIRVNGITQGFFRLRDYTQNNSVFNGKTLTVDFGKYGKEIDFDKIKVEENYQKYASMCLCMERKTPIDENDLSGLSYKYEKLLAHFAKADINLDGEDLFMKKIIAYVSKCSKQLICDSNFAKKDKIDLLKLAVSTSDWDLCHSLINIFELQLNEVGLIDDSTILDFVYDDFIFYIKTNREGERKKELSNLYTLLKSKGARHHKYPATTSIH